MTQGAPPHVVVLGGGSAGWITACLIHQEWGARGGKVTVVESPDIGIIGVGEGSTPQLKALFDHLGIAEADWMPACDATYKLGIRFSGWSERPGFESYFHPFPGPTDLHSEPGFFLNASLARRGFVVPAHPDPWFLASRLAAEGKGPHASPNFPFGPSYGYHFDAYKLGAFLQRHACAHGVTHLPRKVASVERAANGDIAALLCEGGERIGGDIFVDCSGFRAVLIQQALGVPFRTFGENLFNDRAVVMPTAHDRAPLAQTDSIAMRAGWRWSIPLTTRIGNGYVYSSKYISDDEAEAELRAAIGMEGSEQPARFLQMKVGRVEDSWSRNCLAAGLSQGFIEPLEATALHIVIATALEFVRAYESGGFTAGHRDAFNRKAALRYEGIRDYIVAHYRMNQRSDTPYWRDNATNQALSDGLKAMVTAWFTQQDIAGANAAAYEEPHYSAMSWNCLFAGYGTFPPHEKLQPLPANALAGDPDATGAMLDACCANFAEIARA
ncbi:tryptophan halogenase family protein [Novosphingobium sp. MMS21-SN21R]|uniref:tryptophan halogenase family protein n=1 Tax=Novosphingobium sp. MMS21-SN21R TaxID=2969298 RepID=UPI002887D16B|nr:tryptophan halogenase family protein [Novosphingobium sp. MMS21-SN21R]MDT0507658.1 tryptophan halogenase family protein [Novosphingobium sp. MMS21-SN21R]